MIYHAHAFRVCLLAGAIGCLMLTSCSSTTGLQGQAFVEPKPRQNAAATAQTADDRFGTVFSLATPMYLYYLQNDRWPSTANDLQDIARKFDLPLDLSSYSNLDMKELDDGRLRVHFQMAPPSQDEGEFILTKPDTGEPDEIIEPQEAMVV